MKRIFVLACGLIFSLNTFANTNLEVSPQQEKALLKSISSYIMIHAVLVAAKKAGETCDTNLVNAVTENGTGAIAFEAQVNCSSPDIETGGGIVLMIHMKGRAFGDLLDNLIITVDNAG